MKKTNAVRILERLKLSYNLREFTVDSSDLSAERAAELLGFPVGQVFKTLVARGDKSGIVVATVPGGYELDLKRLARLSGNKKVEMVPLKEIQPLTGYIRGAVSPLGIKQNYPFYIDESVYGYSTVVVSAGLRGLQIEIAPEDLVTALGAVSGRLTRD